jgi:hypothetical protein
MSREEYLFYRNTNTSEVIMYNYYIEFFNPDKYSRRLDQKEFFHYLYLWKHAQEAYERVIDYYDVKFTVTKIPNNLGVYYKFI